MAKPQHCDTKHLNAPQLRQQARFLFELFYEFYWLLLATTFECFKATLAMLQRQMLIALPNPSPLSFLLLLLLFPLFLPNRYTVPAPVPQHSYSFFTTSDCIAIVVVVALRSNRCVVLPHVWTLDSAWAL